MPSPDFTPAHDVLRKHGAEHRLAGVSALVIERGEVIDAAGHGLADLEARIPLRPDHIHRAFSNTKAATRNATFFGENGGVEVFHFPTIDINAKMDPDNPPKDGLYLRCGILKVDGEQILDRVSQTLVAQQNCFFRSDKYMGTADIIKYDEKNDIIILEGKNGNVVRMFQFVSGGEPTVVATATKVLYNRKTGKIDTEGVRSLTN